MRETVRSLSVWFVLAGVLGVLSGGLTLLAYLRWLSAPNFWTVYTLATQAGLVLCSVGQVWVGANLARMLVQRPHVPIRVTWAGLLLSLARLNIFGVLLDYYIIHQLKRMAREADIMPEQRILD